MLTIRHDFIDRTTGYYSTYYPMLTILFWELSSLITLSYIFEKSRQKSCMFYKETSFDQTFESGTDRMGNTNNLTSPTFGVFDTMCQLVFRK